MKTVFAKHEVLRLTMIRITCARFREAPSQLGRNGDVLPGKDSPSEQQGDLPSDSIQKNLLASTGCTG